MQRNLACTALDEIHVLMEGEVEYLPESPRLDIRRVSQRPTYDHFFEWIGELAGPDDISIIANGDIWFDASVSALRRYLYRRQCYALSRWERGGLFDRNDSQDCWIFRGKVERVCGDFFLGVPRCDNRLLFELDAAGYEVLNPAFSIRARHLHLGDRPEYGDGGPGFVSPPYRYLWPHNLLGPVATLWQNVRHPSERLGWRFDRRRAESTFPWRVISKVARATRDAIRARHQATRT